MRRGGEGPSVAQVGWRTGVAESRKFFGRGGAVGGGNQHRGSADRLVLYCSTFSAPLSRPPAAGPLCPLRWGFIRGYSHRWVAKEFGPEKSLVMQHKKIARSTAQQHWPVSFLEGELFERPAFAAQRRSQVGAIPKHPEPQPGSLTWESRKPVSSIGLRTPRHDRIPPASHPGGMQEAIPFRDEPIGLSSQPRVVLRTNPGL